MNGFLREKFWVDGGAPTGVGTKGARVRGCCELLDYSSLLHTCVWTPDFNHVSFCHTVAWA